MFKEETTKRLEQYLENKVGEIAKYKVLRIYRKLRFKLHGWKYDSNEEMEWIDPYYASRYVSGNKYYVFRYIYGGVGIFDCIKNFIISAQWAEENNYIPLVSFEREETYKNNMVVKENFYEKLFIQYKGRPIGKVLKNNTVIVSHGNYVDEKKPQVGIQSIDFPMRDERTYWEKVGRLYDKYIQVKPEIKNIYYKEFERLFPKGKKVLGVCIREGFGIADEIETGQYYLRINPREPKNEIIIATVKECLLEWKCEYIYLSAQFQESIDMFLETFPRMVLYYDREYPKKKDYLKAYEKMGDDIRIEILDSIYTSTTEKVMQDYVGQINLLSKCNSLIATESGGAKGALMICHGRYENVKIIKTSGWEMV